MFYNQAKKEAIERLKQEEATYNGYAKKGNDLAIDLYEARKSAAQAILRVEEYINTLANTPKEFQKDVAETVLNIKEFREAVRIEKESSSDNIKGASAAAGGTAVGGAIAALGPTAAMAIATTFGTASTGVAISALSGAAATNATLAFFGGGSLAAGGYGMVGGMMVLGSMVVGPALMVMGLITGAKSHEKLNQALENKAAADETTEALNTMSFKCSAIRRRTYMFYELLSSLDAYFLPLVWKMEDIVNKEGTDYRQYSAESKKTIASAASAACSIKAVLDTPILTEDGALTPESEQITNRIEELIYKE